MSNPQTRIQILVADDHKIVRCGLNSLLDDQDDLTVIGESSSYKQTLALSSTLKPDVILLDLNLSDGNCVEHIPELIALCPNCKILLFTALLDNNTHLRAIHYGVVGVLLKGDNYSAEVLCKAIRHVVLDDELWINETLAAAMQNQNAQIIVADTPLNALTPRENEIACLSAKGLSAKQIGKKLLISEKTVRNQRTIIYNKLGVKNQLELAVTHRFMNVCS